MHYQLEDVTVYFGEVSLTLLIPFFYEGILPFNKSKSDGFKQRYLKVLLKNFRQKVLFYFITRLCCLQIGGRQPEKINKHFFL